ncbi:hypothetical protein CC117_09080 [Parafrankia colletiae]|uniref:Uncharacterized protein n=2 Tax=Parafrankia colletiae TaxID=573497 RepID=A0A1S1RGG5_9ACTN|nr:hypothetical protein CC117_09080 [Parafrankia colletiae]
MARHRRPVSPSRTSRPGSRGRVARPAVAAAATVVAAGAVTVGTAFAVSTGPAPASRIPVPRADVMTASIDRPGAVPPSPSESAVIAEAVRSSSLTSAVPSRSYQVTGTVLAASDQTWAWVELVPVVDDVDRAEAVLHRGEAGWELVQLGSYEVGCGLVPDSVATDLDLECPDDTPRYDA